MSKISYCSIEEAWGTSFTENNNIKDIENNKITNKNINKYDILTEKSEIERENLITNMNKMERNSSNNNLNGISGNGISGNGISGNGISGNSISGNSISGNNKFIDEYNKYRFNPINKVKNNDQDIEYTPFKESIEKKYLQDKLNFLESEFKRYKDLIENNNNKESIENFNNSNIDSENNLTLKSPNNDIIDLIILIIIGLIIIFVLNSIFTLGKNIGSRKHY